MVEPATAATSTRPARSRVAPTETLQSEHPTSGAERRSRSGGEGNCHGASDKHNAPTAPGVHARRAFRRMEVRAG